MKIYIGNVGSLSLQKIMRGEYYGCMIEIYSQFRNPKPFRYYALDNGAYHCYLNSIEWNADLYLSRLKRYIGLPDPDFIVVPDIVCGGNKSLEKSIDWLSILNENNIPSWARYFAVQNGMDFEIIEKSISLFDGIFIGGSKDFKYQYSEYFVQLANIYGLKTHIGGIGTIKGMLWAREIGIDSMDSTSWARNDKIKILSELKYQTTLI